MFPLSFLLNFFLFFLDRISKNFILKNQVIYLGKLIHLSLSKNPNLFFIPIDQNLLIIFSVITLFFLLFFLFKSRQTKEWLIFNGLFLILLGGLSNLYDRLIFGYVIDFIWFFLFPFSIFNIADVMIFLGVVLILVKLFKK